MSESTIAIIISVLAILLSIMTYIRNGKSTRNDLLRNLVYKFEDTKKDSEQIVIEMSELLSKKSADTITTSEQTKLDILYKVLKSRDKAVLNQIEVACSAFFKKEVSKKAFQQEFTEDIRRYVKHERYKKEYTPPITSYPQTVQYYERICKLH